MQRQSNFELLRIVSMLLILIVHIDGASIGLPQPLGDTASLTARDWWKLVVESISIIGVNCFVLISGYFGIKPSWKGFIRFASYCMFYSVAIYCIVAMGINGDWNWKEFGESFMIFTHTDLWFIPAYLGLYLLTPFINRSIDTFTFKKYSICLGAIILFNIYAGWFWGGKFNPNGYTVLHLVMIYFIGRYINRFSPQIKNMRIYASIAWVISTGMILLSSLYTSSIMAFAYNSPFVILASISFFMIFKSMNFTNVEINYFAPSAFAAYLIHKNPLIWVPFCNWIKDVWEQLSLPVFTIASLAIAISVLSVCIIIDLLRRYIMQRLKI